MALLHRVPSISSDPSRFSVRPVRGAAHQRVWLTAPLFGNLLVLAIERWYRYCRDSFESRSSQRRLRSGSSVRTIGRNAMSSP